MRREQKTTLVSMLSLFIILSLTALAVLYKVQLKDKTE